MMLRKALLAAAPVVVLLCSAVSASPAAASFGFSSVEFSASEAPPAGSAPGALGPADVRAGSHPWAVTTKFAMNMTGQPGVEVPDGSLKDVYVQLPAGLVGDVNAVPQCSIKQFETQFPEEEHEGSAYEFSGASCAPNTQVGFANVRLAVGGNLGNKYFDAYNLVSPPGAPAQFGISPLKVPVIFRPTVRSGGDYGLTIAAQNIVQFERVGASTVTFWGVPGEPGHDALRGECLGVNGAQPFTTAGKEDPGKECAFGSTPQPFLTLPTSCTAGPLAVTFIADSWEHPGSYNADGTPDLSDPSWVQKVAEMPAMQGCAKPAFEPSLTASPDTLAADSPAGLTVDVKTPQDGLLSPAGIAPAQIQETTVTLPAGMAINPGQAAGLGACQHGDGGQPGEDDLGSQLPAHCPSASKVGTVEIETPLLRDKVEGDVFVLQSSPPELELLIVAAADGVEVKLPVKVHLDGATGQLTATVSAIPQFPITDFKLAFSGGAQAALTTPPTCGTYTTNSDFLPWSAPFSPTFPTTTSFEITTGPGGSRGECGPLPFAPVMTAGATTDQAGGYTGFSLLLQRADGQQRISGLQFKTPPGLSGMIAGVPLCDEADANAGTCPAASQIGHTVVTAGPGPYPLVVPQPGQPPAAIYLTQGYHGAPYGLSIVVPLVVGPFTLQTQVVRAAIAVDPHTAQLTITTDALPPIVDGVPTDLRTIDAVVDRPRFMFNPTNCTPQAFTGTALSTEGASAPLSYRFQVGGCQGLAFKPDFKVSTSGKTSKKYGASLDAKVIYPPVPLGANQAAGQANIASVKVDLPKQLPSRLTTLQKACLAKVFEANPASCPAASVVGRATAITPVLPVPLTGPAYFVSHGGEAFPSLIIVLQGYGVTIDLVATTFISKAGITSSTFKQVPDVPFSSFDLNLPQGPYSALAANGNLCTSKLAMPTAFTAQNGAVIHQSTKITVGNCPKVKAAKKKPAKARKASNRQGDRRVK
jgi:hypothetical protein